jgi:hypothetical protein
MFDVAKLLQVTACDKKFPANCSFCRTNGGIKSIKLPVQGIVVKITNADILSSLLFLVSLTIGDFKRETPLPV